MRPPRVRLLEKSLGALQWCLVVAAIWVLAKATLLRDALPQPAVAAAVDTEDVAPVAGDATEMDGLAGIWQRDLQQELIPKPPEKKPEPKAPPPPPPVALPKLLATFVEDGQAWGLFVESGGSQRVRAVAGAVDGFTIVSIAPGRATVEKAGQTYELEIPRPNSEPAPRMTTRRN